MADVEFSGMNPGAHHLTNVAVHTVATLLLLLLLVRLTGAFWRSLFVASLFALHPMHVESVAWIAERKDVLSAFFWFLTLILYAEYLSRRKAWLYLTTLVSFILGLMSKPMLVTLPVVMLLLDFWPFRRLEDLGEVRLSTRVGTLVVEKLPFFACSLVSSIIAIYAQKISGAVIAITTVPLSLRVENALVSYLKYLGLTLWPHDLAILYPFPVLVPNWQVAGSLAFLLLASAAAFLSRRHHPYLVLGWFWFLVTLLPVIGLIQVGTQAMADRFSYLPSVGLFTALTWGACDLAGRVPYRSAVLSVVGAGLLIAATALTWQQIEYWEDSFVLFRHALQVTTGNHIMHNNLGVALDGKDASEEAIKEFQEAVHLKPDYLEARYNLGVALYKGGQLDAAINEFRMALRINPNYVQAYHNLGLALSAKGDLEGAIREYRSALEINPRYVLVYNKLGIVLAGRGDLDGAVLEFQKALQIDPGYGDAAKNLEHYLAQKEKRDQGKK
jgi:tetratricopeptide (TPR) repeat protein